MNQTAELALDKAVVGLFKLKGSVFLSTIYCGLHKFWDMDCPTAYVQGTKMGINPDWFLSLTPNSRISLIGHETYHVALKHPERMGNRDPQIWNEACDHAINLMMLDHGFVFDMPGCYDPKFSGMSAEAIYDILIQRKDSCPNPFGLDIRQGSSKDPEEVVKQNAEIDALIIRASVASAMSPDAGNIPGEASEIITKLLKPRIPWTQQLAKWLTQRSEETYTWSRPNRRFSDMYLPGKGGNDGLEHLAWAVDSSYSMSPRQLQLINSELASAKSLFNPEKMTILVFDTKIRTIKEYDRSQELRLLEFHGRGGTDMCPLFEWAAKNKPTAMIVFSDMECLIPDEIPGVKTLWVCFDDPSWIQPYGDVIHIDSLV